MRNAEVRAPRTSGRVDPQRLIGLGVMVAVLRATIIVGAARGRSIAGEALAQPVGPAPTVGDCLTENLYKSGVDLSVWTPDLPSLQIEPCTGPRFGEVVLVVADFTAAMATIEPANNPYRSCHTQSDTYMQIPQRLVLDDGVTVPSTPSGTEFSPAADVLVALVGPNPRQRAAGQKWAACVIFLPRSVIPEVPTTIDHSLRGAWLRDDDKGLFSLCLAGPTSQVATNCHWPHRFEMVGMGWGNPSASQVSIDTACRESAVQALGSSAALTGGTVTPVVVPVRPNPNNDGGLVSGPAAVTAESPYLNICLVTTTDSTQRLIAPLRGLGEAPVPIK